MKRRIVVLFALLCLGLFTLALAAEDSSLYPVRLDVVKVFSHSDGYKILYRKGAANVAELYIPITWFVPGGKAELIRGNDSAFPFVMVYYRDGKFDHLKLCVKTSIKDLSWGQLSQAEGAGKFEGFTEPQIKY